MFDLFWCDRWDEEIQEPAGMAILLKGGMASLNEAMSNLLARAPVARLDHGDGECVVLDRLAGEREGRNVRVSLHRLANPLQVA